MRESSAMGPGRASRRRLERSPSPPAGPRGAGTPLEGIAFLGGGTGGHLYPALAIAERAAERHPGCRLLFVRTRRAVEDHVFAGVSFPQLVLDLDPPGGGLTAWTRWGLQGWRAVGQVRRALRGRFDAAVGLGGYASLPGIVAARREGIPVVLLEQNHVPGRANRLLGPLAHAISCPSAEVSRLVGRRGRATGNPVRRAVLEAAGARAARPAPPRRTLLVAGGSQGARGLNEAVARALPALEAFRAQIHWIHVAGPAQKPFMEECYRQGGWSAEVHGFTADLPRLLAGSDLVIARAGGTTLAELAVLGLPAVLVPYPHHRDRHQWLNALAFARAGGARVVAQEALTPAALQALVVDVLFCAERLEGMGRAARSLARPEAAGAVLDLLVEARG